MTSNEERSSPLGMFLLGLTFGLAAGGIGVYVWQQRELQRRSAQFEAEAAKALKTGTELLGNVMSPVTNGGGTATSNEDKLKKLGDECVEDLRVDRLLSVYRLTTKDYQQKVPRYQFDQMVHKVAKLRNISTASSSRESKVRKGADGKRMEYYCTAGLINVNGVVNVALTFVESDGEWRIDEIELRQDS